MFLFSLPKLKSRPAVVAAAALLLFPLSAPPALAWESACAEFQFPKVWFDGKFQVLYGFERMPPEEGPHYNGRRWETKPVRESQYHRLAGWGATSGYRVTPGEVARGATGWSGTMRTGNKRCVSLADVRPGEKFVFYMVPGVGAGARDQDGIFCGTHSSNPDPYYHQQDRPYRKIWWRVWGTIDNPRCEFHQETN